MGKRVLEIEGFFCERCRHEWISRGKRKEPMVCPKCKTPYWDEPRRK